jgi:molecular chaperone GrpE
MEYEQETYQPTESYSIADEETILITSDSPNIQVKKDEDVPNVILDEDALTTTLQDLVAAIEQLRQDFDAKLKYDNSKERQIDSLHNELQAYRADLYFKILRPVILDLISMHDDFSRLIGSTSSVEDMIPVAQVLKNLESFQGTIEEILLRNGVESYSVEEETFVSGKQRALQAIDTTEASQDRQIRRRVSKGFAYQEKILRPELVETYRFRVQP